MSGTVLGSAIYEIGIDDSKFTTGLDNAERKAGGSVSAISSIGSKLAVFGLAAGGVKVLTSAIGGFLSDAMESQKVSAQTEAVIKSTGGAAGLSAAQIGDMASSLSKIVPIDDETIQSAENMLLTFTNIGKDVFPDATKAALDMATALGTDPVAAATTLGKALQDPVAGVSALQRVGVRLTDQQKEQVKAMVDAGDAAGAQALILKELQTEFGGSAEAAGKTFGGQMTILNTKIGNVKEQIGMALIPAILALAGVFSSAIDAAQPLIGFISDNIKPVLIGLATALLVVVVPAFVAWALAAGAAALATLTALAPVILTAAAVGLAAAGLYEIWNHNFLGIRDITKTIIDWLSPYVSTAVDGVKVAIETAITAARAVFDTVFPAIQAVVETVMPILSTVVGTYIGLVQREIELAVGAVKWAFDNVFMPIQGVVSDVLSTISGLVDTLWSGGSGAVSKITGAVDTAKGYFDTVFVPIQGVVNDVFTTISSLVDTLWTGATGGVQKILGGVSAIAGVFDYKTWLGYGSGIINGLVDGINAAWQGIQDKIDAVLGLLDKIPDWLKPGSPSKTMTALGVGMVQGFALGIDKTLPMLAASVASMNGIIGSLNPPTLGVGGMLPGGGAPGTGGSLMPGTGSGGIAGGGPYPVIPPLSVINPPGTGGTGQPIPAPPAILPPPWESAPNPLDNYGPQGGAYQGAGTHAGGGHNRRGNTYVFNVGGRAVDKLMTDRFGNIVTRTLA